MPVELRKECSESANFDFANAPRRLQSEEGADSLEGGDVSMGLWCWSFVPCPLLTLQPRRTLRTEALRP